MDNDREAVQSRAILIIIERTKKREFLSSPVFVLGSSQGAYLLQRFFLLFGRDSSRAYQSKQGPNAKIHLLIISVS